MPTTIGGKNYYRTAEVCSVVGIGKSTLFRWIKKGIVNEAECRDRKGWRLFTEDEVSELMAEANKIRKNHIFEGGVL
jgi:predicted site-specific integrase-resolvase